jgi:hypothetical protein
MRSVLGMALNGLRDGVLAGRLEVLAAIDRSKEINVFAKVGFP